MIQQIVAKKTLTKKWQIIIKNVLDKKSTDQLAVHFLFYKKNILLIVLYDCKIIKPPLPMRGCKCPITILLWTL